MDRSMLPVIQTIPWPIPTSRYGQMERTRGNRFLGLMKFGFMIANTTSRIATPIYAVMTELYFFMFRSPI
jgi:hypothetical protein